MTDACQDLNIALTIDEHISAIEKMVMVHSTTTNVKIDACHNNVTTKVLMNCKTTVAL